MRLFGCRYRPFKLGYWICIEYLVAVLATQPPPFFLFLFLFLAKRAWLMFGNTILTLFTRVNGCVSPLHGHGPWRLGSVVDEYSPK